MRSYSETWKSLVALGALTLGCSGPPLQTPIPEVHQQTPIRVEQNVKNKVDILFMIDNSNSMDAMQTELKNRFPQFFKVFSDLAQSGTLTDLQIGVVSSDYGAGATKTIEPFEKSYFVTRSRSTRKLGKLSIYTRNPHSES